MDSLRVGGGYMDGHEELLDMKWLRLAWYELHLGR